MIKLDKIKILTKSEYITDINPKLVEIRLNCRTNIELYIINQKQPFNLFIQSNPITNEAVIEFSSKILLDDYPKMISNKTIFKCFANICKMEICQLQIDKIIKDSQILTCDVTKDIEGIILPKDIKTVLISNLKNPSKFNIQKYGTSGYTITKAIKTKSLQLRLSFYDKYKELHKASNSNFIKMLVDPENVMNYFKNRFRIESNLKTKKQIRDFFQTADTSILNILNSNENVLMKIFDAIFTENEIEGGIGKTDRRTIYDYDSLNQLGYGLILKECKYDLSLVKNVLDRYLSPNTNKRKYISGFKILFNTSLHQNQDKLIIGQIRDKLVA